MRMKVVESHVPPATSQMVARCIFGVRRFQPKIHRPMNVDSSMKAARPSIASVDPKTSPTNVE